MSPRVTVRCRACDGRGCVPLVPSLQVALDEIRYEGMLSAPGLAEILGIRSEAAINRMEKLRATLEHLHEQEKMIWSVRCQLLNDGTPASVGNSGRA